MSAKIISVPVALSMSAAHADDLKDNTVAANAPLMDYLEDLIVSLDYDLQAFQRIASRQRMVAKRPNTTRLK